MKPNVTLRFMAEWPPHVVDEDERAAVLAGAEALEAAEQEHEVVQQIIEEALTTDGAHHKNWYLTMLAQYLELPITVDYEPGIAP